MMRRVAVGLSWMTLWSVAASAQDVPGIEICTVDKTWERRTSCLQSNVDFLVKTINKTAQAQQQKIDAANRQVETLSNAVIALQKTVAELQAAQAKVTPSSPAKDAAPAKDGAK